MPCPPPGVFQPKFLRLHALQVAGRPEVEGWGVCMRGGLCRKQMQKVSEQQNEHSHLASFNSDAEIYHPV